MAPQDVGHRVLDAAGLLPACGRCRLLTVSLSLMYPVCQNPRLSVISQVWVYRNSHSRRLVIAFPGTEQVRHLLRHTRPEELPGVALAATALQASR
jgi:hypothetical protein